MSVVRLKLGATLCLLLLTAVGCNGDSLKLVKAAGTVKYKGEPLAGANVTAVYSNKHVAAGITDANGKFVLTTNGRAGAPVGQAKVSVTKVEESEIAKAMGTSTPKPEDMMKMFQKTKPGESMKTQADSTGTVLPTKYANPDSSNLSITIPEGGVEDLELNLLE